MSNECTNLDPATDQYWREDMRQARAGARESAQFFTDLLRANIVSGSVGVRESVAMNNIPPVSSTAAQRAAGDGN